MQFHCPVCGQEHDDLPHMVCDRPDQWWDIPESEREERIELTSDTCVIDDRDFFIRGVIEIPVHEHPEPFGFGVWVSQKRENFAAYLDQPDAPMAHFRGGGLRPTIRLEPSGNPLSIDQREGITLQKALEIVHWYERQE